MARREPLIDRPEVVAALFTLNDVNKHLERIQELIEEELGGEEGFQEDDA